MRLALVYFQECEEIGTKEALCKMKKFFSEKEYEVIGLFIDSSKEYNHLLEMIINHLKKAEVLLLYSRNNIPDDFFWQLLLETARIENIEIKVYLES